MSRIITFYSYKGGVGRTSALANVAVLLAKMGKRVLTIDWDLEAPGLDRYFDALTRARSSSKGLAHMLSASKNDVLVSWKDYTSSYEVDGGMAITLIPSGHSEADYAEIIRSFSWADFFGVHQGGSLLDQLREDWKANFDFVLIDSRTGITDAGGVCTVFMPDILVLVFAANRQSLEGGIQITNGAQVARKDLEVRRPPLAILPLPGKFDGRDEIDESSAWLKRFAIELKPYYDDWLPKQFEASRILELTKIPYISKFSFGEPLSVLLGVTDPELPGYYLNNVALLLATDFADALRMLAPTETPQALVADLKKKLAEEASLDENAIDVLVTNLSYLLGDGTEFCELLNDVSTALAQNGEFELALKTIKRSAEVARTLPVDSPLSLATLELFRTNVGYITDFGEAEGLYKEYIDKLHQLDAPPQTLVLRAHNGLGELYWQLGRMTEAEEELSLALKVARSIDAGEQILSNTLSNLGRVRYALGSLEEAEQLQREALSILRSAHRPEEVLIINACNNLAATLRDRGNLLEAESLYSEVMARLKLSNFPSSNFRVVRAYNNLADIYREKGEIHLAEALYRELIDSLLKSARPNDSTVVRAFNSLAGILREKRRFGRSQICLQAGTSAAHPPRPSLPIIETFGALLELMVDQGDTGSARELVNTNPALTSRILNTNQKSTEKIKELISGLGDFEL